MDYQGSKKEILEKIGSDPKKGLSSNEASSRLEKYGPNKIESSNKKSLGKKILEQILSNGNLTYISINSIHVYWR